MHNGYLITCPKCGAKIDEFSCADEWFCACGEQGILQWDDVDEEDEGDE